jgi:hypothetical protein
MWDLVLYENKIPRADFVYEPKGSHPLAPIANKQKATKGRPFVYWLGD